MRLLFTLLLLVCPLVAQQWIPESVGAQRFTSIDTRPSPPSSHKALYSVSVTALIGSNAIDLASSWGRPELNPVLSPGSNGGRFGWQSATIKLGLAAGTLAFQHYILRRRPELRRSFAITNFIAAGAMSGVAVRNQLHGAPRLP